MIETGRVLSHPASIVRISAGIGLFLLLVGPSGAGDWRGDLLEAEGFRTDGAGLREAMAGARLDAAKLAAAYQGLGSESFPERERAEATILSVGPDALAWLGKQPVSPQPEVRMRVKTIRRNLELASGDRRGRMLRHAAGSLLEELGGAPDPSTGGIFYEWFGEPARKIAPRYRTFHYTAPAGMTSRIEDRMLRHEGDRPGDDDQRLLLKAADWPGRPVFPDRFSVTTTLGGSAGGEGVWHLGVSVGGVRALYHPGYAGGAFRFEQVEGNIPTAPNRSMGFTPSTDKMQRMRVEVQRRTGGRVRLAVVIQEDGGEPFETSSEFDRDTIGPLDAISLDRSGRRGGDARFADLVVELGKD